VTHEECRSRREKQNKQEDLVDKQPNLRHAKQGAASLKRWQPGDSSSAIEEYALLFFYYCSIRSRARITSGCGDSPSNVLLDATWIDDGMAHHQKSWLETSKLNPSYLFEIFRAIPIARRARKARPSVLARTYSAWKLAMGGARRQQTS